MNLDLFDSTTGLLDRKTFDTEFAAAVSQAQMDSNPLGLIFVDVDRFKKVNDEHGHPKGDQVLAEVSRRLASCSKGKGVVYRYGGEEIVIVLPNHDLHETLALAERCRTSLEREAVSDLPITASFGASIFPDMASSAQQLLETADKAMYDAKNRGRNLVRYHGEPAPELKAKSDLVARKVPEAGKLTEAQLLEMRQLYFKNRAIECPNDGAFMRTKERSELGKAKLMVIAHCPQCGLQVDF
jgi:diguanylate cyclase (GGDEF)-like protein